MDINASSQIDYRHAGAAWIAEFDGKSAVSMR